MLEQLIKYARDREWYPEPGFAPKSVRWLIACDEEGRFLDVVELGDPAGRRNPGQTFPACPDLTQGEMISGGEVRSHFLVDTAEVAVLYKVSPEQKKLIQKHEYFVNLLRKAGEIVPELRTAAFLFSNEETLRAIRERLTRLKAKPNDKVTVKVGGIVPLEAGEWHGWWREFRSGLRKEKDLARMRCLVTGELAPPAATHLKIKHLADVGGHASGDVLIGFDKEAFRSYGLKQSANAAVSEEAMCAYSQVLNHLIREQGRRIAKVKVVYWFKEKIKRKEDPLAWLEEGGETEERHALHLARTLLDSIRTGARADLTENYFYALTLSGAGGRVMVRDWMEGQFEELVTSISRWFGDLTIVHREGGKPALPPKFLAVLGATVRDLDELAPPLVTKMWRVAVRGEPLPQEVLAQALDRVRTSIMKNEAIPHAAMGLLKMYHLRKHPTKGGDMSNETIHSHLNPEHPSPAYQCGRLMAVLAGLQRSALGDVGAGLVQRYYAAASATPALVLGRLTRTSQFHLNKLHSDSPGLAYWFEDRIAEIWGRIRDTVPVTLTLEEQSLFALGYYQQMAHFRTPKSTEETPKEE